MDGSHELDAAPSSPDLTSSYTWGPEGELVPVVRWWRLVLAWVLKGAELAAVAFVASRLPVVPWLGAGVYAVLGATWLGGFVGAVRQRRTLDGGVEGLRFLVPDPPIAVAAGPLRPLTVGVLLLLAAGGASLLVWPGVLGVEGLSLGGRVLLGVFAGAHLALAGSQALSAPVGVADGGLVVHGVLVPWTACRSFANETDRYVVEAEASGVPLTVDLPKRFLADPCEVGRLVEARVEGGPAPSDGA